MKISVVIPVYNAVKFIPRFVGSLSRQTMGDFEAIFVDDCSLDGSVALLETYCAEDKRFELVRMRENQGPMLARREGLAVAKGAYVCFADVDDLLPENAFESLLGREADIVFGAYRKELPDGRLKYCRQTLAYGSDRAGVCKAILKEDAASALWGKLFRRELFQKDDYRYYAGLKNGEDTLFFLQVLERARSFAVVDEIVYIYRYEKSSLSKIKTPEQLAAQMRAKALNLSLMGRYPQLEKDIEINRIRFVTSRLKEGVSIGDVKKYMGDDGIESHFAYSNLRKNFGFMKSLRLYIFFHSKLVRSLYHHTILPLRSCLEMRSCFFEYY